jgi:hypothetical protein
LTEALGGVVFSAVALFDLLTSSGLHVALDVLGIFLALAGSMLGLLLSRNLMGGLLRKPILILALSPLLLAVAEALEVVSEYMMIESTVIVLLQGLFELFFLVVLFLGFFMLHRTLESFGEAGQVKV